jgi:predicted lipoprotein
MAFRQQILNQSGRTKIQAAQDKLLELCKELETIKPLLAPTAQDTTLTHNIITNVIIKSYTELLTQSDALLATLTQLKETPTVENIQKAREAWRATRKPWEASEGHIFGPVDTLGIDPKVDSWPVEISSLDGALGGYDASFTSIDGFPVTMKGFHAIEYLLFGDGKTLEDETTTLERLLAPVGEESAEDKIRLIYLEALGKSFRKDIAKLVEAW